MDTSLIIGFTLGGILALLEACARFGGSRVLQFFSPRRWLRAFVPMSLFYPAPDCPTNQDPAKLHAMVAAMHKQRYEEARRAAAEAQNRT